MGQCLDDDRQLTQACRSGHIRGTQFGDRHALLTKTEQDLTVTEVVRSTSEILGRARFKCKRFYKGLVRASLRPASMSPRPWIGTALVRTVPYTRGSGS